MLLTGRFNGTERWMVMGMARLIDADALEDSLGISDMDIYAKESIREAPTIDAVSVVRCKECKHYMTIHCTCDGCCISDDWYCADGERKVTHWMPLPEPPKEVEE